MKNALIPGQDGTPVSAPKRAVPQVNCDLCGWPMDVPQHCIEQGQIAGLLVCSGCIEDNLNARADEPRAEVGMVGGRS